ncbi:MAG: hypothetical protein E7057_02980 [Lentisphaerae bacterium]|nr:hypothetical protein [Lentisphaerota bacterium]
MKLKYQPTEPLKQTPHIVAFLDFLGASEKMRDPKENNKFLQSINYVYSFANYIHKDMKKSYKSNIKIKIFSDNIIIATEIQDTKNIMGYFANIEHFSLLLYMNALLNHNIIRGAISIGNLYMDDTLVYGEALLNAFNGESKIANYPRIIIERTIFDYISKEMLNLCNFLEVDEVIREDIDGELYLNPFWGIALLDGGKSKVEQYLRRNGSFILHEYKKLLAKNKTTVFPKYHWLANQFNEYCHANNHPFLINLDKLTLEGKNE